MNMILAGFVEDFAPIAYNIFRSVNIDRCILVSKDKEIFPTGMVGIQIDYEDVKYGYYKKVDWNIIPPLDRIIIEQMAFCEIEVLKMMERLEGVHGKPLTYEDRKRMYYRHLRYWNYMIESQMIDVFVSSDVPHEVYDFIVYSLCKIKTIKTIMFYRMPTFPYKNVSKYILEDIKGYNLEIKKSYERIMESLPIGCSESDIELSDSFNAYYAAHTKKTIEPMAFIKTEALPIIKTIEKRMSTGKYLLSNGNYKLLFQKTFELINIKIRGKSAFARGKNLIMNEAKAYYEKHSVAPDYSEKYVFFALHYQPECTTSPMAGVFVHQLLMIQMLSYYLSDDVVIYVKEHPRNDLKRELDFYKDIISMKNVKFISKEESSIKLIDNAFFVATATGTAGWEAFLRRKPVVMFGYYIYQYAPRVFHIDSCRDCQRAIERIVENNEGASEKEIKVFLKAMENIAIPGHLNNRYRDICLVSPEENIEYSSRAIINKLKQIEENKSN